MWQVQKLVGGQGYHCAHPRLPAVTLLPLFQAPSIGGAFFWPAVYSPGLCRKGRIGSPIILEIRNGAVKIAGATHRRAGRLVLMVRVVGAGSFAGHIEPCSTGYTNPILGATVGALKVQKVAHLLVLPLKLSCSCNSAHRRDPGVAKVRRSASEAFWGDCRVAVGEPKPRRTALTGARTSGP